MTTKGGHASRKRVIDASYDLFSLHGVRAVNDGEIMTETDVTEATLRELFPARGDLVKEFLDEREMRSTIGMVEAKARERGTTPEARLLAIFDVFDDWFNSDGFDACSFINGLIENGPAASTRAGKNPEPRVHPRSCREACRRGEHP